MGNFDRPTEPEDYVRDALIVFLLMRSYDHSHGSFKDERLEIAFILFLRLLELSGVSLKGLFYDKEDDPRLAVTNALSRMNIEGATFSKTRNDGRHYFENYFYQWAERVTSKDLPKEMLPACMAVVEETMSVLVFGDNPDRVLDRWKEKQKQSASAAS